MKRIISLLFLAMLGFSSFAFAEEYDQYGNILYTHYDPNGTAYKSTTPPSSNLNDGDYDQYGNKLYTHYDPNGVAYRNTTPPKSDEAGNIQSSEDAFGYIQEFEMPKYNTEKERLAHLPWDSSNYYEYKYRMPVNPETVKKVSAQTENMRDPNTRKLKDQKTVAQNMQQISIPVWQIGKNGQKYSTKLNLTVLKAIAPDVQAIFNEIYNGKEKFPIHSIGGYAYRNGSGYHPLGLAIDINPTYNPQFKVEGDKITPLVGSYYDPDKYPQSIGKDSDVVKAFGKRGWTWGAKFPTPDVMHFSYLEW